MVELNVVHYFCTPKQIINTMATNRTFTMIKPDATGAGNTGKIIDRIIGAGFTIKAMKWTQLTREDAMAFYAVHAERPFYGELVEYMSSGPIVAAVLEKDNAVADFRELSELLTQLRLHLVLSVLTSLRALLTQFTVLILTKTLLSKVHST